MTKLHLPGLTTAEFLRRHWQKRPLLARGAVPGLGDFLQRDSIFELATRDDLESRLVIGSGRRWTVRPGPFSKRELSRIRDRKWSLLVHGINHALPAAQKLLEQFAFVPYARLDDVMVSYAPPGGGVGPHFDSYDVFLVQGRGARRWRVGRSNERDLLPGAPLRILRRFGATSEWVVQPGDLLYLPPRWAHEGVAITECVTYSVGFRAPGARELAARFLEFLQDRLELEGIYGDPDLERQRHPAGIGARMVERVGRMLDGIRWGPKDVASFLGRYLTEPKAHVVYRRPARPFSAPSFAAAATRRGLHLALTTQMLFRGRAVFVNGEEYTVGANAMRLLAALADRRALPPGTRPGREALARLYEWYRAGYIILGDG